MKKVLKILGIIIVSLVVLFCLLWSGSYYYGRYQGYMLMRALKQPYVEDAETSLGAETPMEAYQQFRQILASGDTETALLYIFENTRDKYQEEFQDQERIEIYLNMPETLNEDNVYDCGSEAFACLQRADYYYEYEETEAEEYEFEGNKFTIDPGIYSHNINFIKNLAGKWQILDL